MDKDRMKDAGDQSKGPIKEVAGKMTGDSKLQAEGTLEKARARSKAPLAVAKDAMKNR